MKRIVDLINELEDFKKLYRESEKDFVMLQIEYLDLVIKYELMKKENNILRGENSRLRKIFANGNCDCKSDKEQKNYQSRKF